MGGRVVSRALVALATSFAMAIAVGVSADTAHALTPAVPSTGIAAASGGEAGSGSGAAWSAPVAIVDSSQPLTRVTCTSPSFCVAIDDHGNVATFDGMSWSLENINGGNAMTAVACASSDFCIASGKKDASYDNWFVFDGTEWTSENPTYWHFDDISCVSKTFCAAVSPTVGALHFDGAGWQVGTYVSGRQVFALQDVSCPAANLCVGTFPNGIVTTYNGSEWSERKRIDEQQVRSHADQKWTSVSCASPEFCAVVDSIGNAVMFNGQYWSDPITVKRGTSLQSVSCATATWCVAADDTGRVVTFDGADWSAPAPVAAPGAYITSVSCVSASFCMAVDSAGNAYTIRQEFSVSAESLQPATIGAPYSFTLAAYAGARPYTWTAVSTLPAGLALSSAGVLSGTPTRPGDYTIRVSVRDSSTPSPHTATSTVRLHVAPLAYQPINPQRLFDTRSGTGGVPRGPIGAHKVIRVKVAGMVGVPPYATAIALNVTAVGASRATFVTVYPDGVARPNASTLNPTPGAARANFTIVPIGAAGYIDVYNDAGSTHVLADVQGYYAAGASYHGLSARRGFDTRTGAGGVPAAKLGPRGLMQVKVTGVHGVPSTATAVALNVTAVGASTPTFVTAYPYGSARPQASTLNPNSGTATANFVIVKVGAGGYISVYNDSGRLDVLADVQGYFDAGSDYTALAPKRVLDTRTGTSGIWGLLSPHTTIAVKVRGVAGVPANATAVALNITAVDAYAPTFLTAYPHGSTRPHASTLNTSGFAATANFAIVRIGPDGYITIYNDAAYLHVLADVQGYVVG